MNGALVNDLIRRCLTWTFAYMCQKVFFKSCLSSRKIHLSWTNEQDFFLGLYVIDVNPQQNFRDIVLKEGNFRTKQSTPLSLNSKLGCLAFSTGSWKSGTTSFIFPFEVCKMLKRPFRANCLNLFYRHVLIIINRIHTVCCQYLYSALCTCVCIFMLSLAK